MEFAVYIPEQEPQVGQTFSVFPDFLLRHRAGCIGTYRLKHGREAALFALYMSGKHRSA